LEVHDCFGDAELSHRLLDLARTVNLMDDLRAHGDLGRRDTRAEAILKLAHALRPKRGKAKLSNFDPLAVFVKAAGLYADHFTTTKQF
jgi:hypothetical protein